MAHWIAHLDGGPRRVNHAAVSVGDHIYSFGGYCTGGNYEQLDPIDAFVFSIGRSKWSPITYGNQPSECPRHLPFQRYGHSVVAEKDKIYLWGGRNDTSGADNKLYAFDTKTSRWMLESPRGHLPDATDGHTACVIGNRMYVFGGFIDLMQSYSNLTYALDFREMKWTLLQPKGGEVPHWRDFHTATPFGDHMYVFGGRSDVSGPWYTGREFYCNRLKMFDTRNSQWLTPRATGDEPIGRRSHSAVLYDNHLCVFGGFNHTIDTHFNDLHKLDLSSMEWKKVECKGKIPCKRRRQCCIVHRDRMIMFGGTSPREKYIPGGSPGENLIDLADLHILDFEPSLKTMCQMTIINEKIDPSCLPKTLRWEIAAMTTNSDISQPCEATQQG
ncbi:kelch domain-containing protein 3-like [Diadema antillarum]|uniref:kelch domain-containing protein 3-like n=1 Tax=Diadema antillarum TaxID=105358 RepID=UPI003A8C4BE9